MKIKNNFLKEDLDMINIRKIFERVTCDHNFAPVTNIGGDMIDRLNCRSIYCCSKCGKVKRSGNLIEGDNIPVNFNYKV